MNQHPQHRAWKVLAVISLVFGLMLLTILHTVVHDGAAVACFVLLPVFLFGVVVVIRSLWPLAQSNSTLPPSPKLPPLFQRPPPIA
jgi:hypothetical protein